MCSSDLIDRVTGFWPEGGKAGLGKWRANKDVDPSEWFFKAHFFQDPVQPGSLGIEAMIQLAQFVMLHRGMAKGMKNPHFEALASGDELKWKYRGQVVPKNKLIQTELEVTKVTADTLWCEAHLWVDGKRIYSAWNLGMRLVDGPVPKLGGDTSDVSRKSPSIGTSRITNVSVPVPVDHCPTYVLPALPAMTMVMLALSATGGAGLREATVTRWLTFPEGPRSVTATVTGDRVVLGAPEPFFTATVAAPEPPLDLPALRNPVPGPDGAELYASGDLFHGPAFHVVERVVARGDNGATLLLKPAPPDVLLDGITHGIPHDHLERWCPEIAPGQVGYPSRIERLSLYGAPPARSVRAEIRFMGLVSGRPLIAANLYDGDAPIVSVTFLEVLLPKGRIGDAPAALRRDFLRGRAGTGVSLSRVDGDEARLTAAEVRSSDWLPGTVQRVFGSTDPTVIAAKEAAGARLGLHPRDVQVADGRAWDTHRPLRGIRFSAVAGGVDVSPESALEPVIQWWRNRGDTSAWPGEELVRRMAARWLTDLVVHDPAGLTALRGRPVLYLGNHQNYLESVLFTTIASWLGDVPVRALAKVEHRERWLGRLERLLTTWPGHEQPPRIAWFDQQDPASLPAIVRGALDQSLLVHVEGSRQVQPGQRVDKISSLWVDVALEARVPIVPVAFRGGQIGRAHV